MITIWIVLSVILLVIPVTCTIFALHAKGQQKKRAEVIKNATTRTTVHQGPNGRTVFEASTSHRLSPPRSPILPITQQQANKGARPKSLKDRWSRMSRPFSMMPAAVRDDQIELTKNLKHMPSVSCASGQEGPVSPLSPRSRNLPASSSWRTYDDLESETPVSPISMTNMPQSSSITGTILRGYQHNSLTRNAERMQEVPLTPPGRPEAIRKTNRKGTLDYGTSRGFMPPSAVADRRYAPEPLRTNVVDANQVKINEVKLAPPPKTKTSKRR